jgi:hypothetical protein
MRQKVTDETHKLFQERIVTKHLDGLGWSVIDNTDLKMSKDKMCGKTIINNASVRFQTGVDVIFEINEDVFMRLSDKHQIIVVDKLLADIDYDMEDEKVKRCAKDVQEHSGIIERYGNEVTALSSEIARVYQELKEDNTRTDGKEE